MYESVKIYKATNDKLTTLANQRKADGNPVSTKIAIIAELVTKACKKECKQ